jgi:hypothetical protein
MSPIHWLEFGVAMHVALAFLAIFFASRVDGYTAEQRRLQYLIAALVPLLGAITVYVMAREADAELPKPKPSTQKFDRAGD